jgi:4-hydroxybenzoate polyprenyltransferase
MRKTVNQVVDDDSECRPLVVDLDGTLIRSDLLIESAFSHLGQNPVRLGAMLATLFKGKAAFKAHIAAMTSVDASHLPYDDQVIELIKHARSFGRPVYLASASNERHVGAIASHLGLFEGWFGSTHSENLSCSTKSNRLIEAFGEGCFDYVGNDVDDLQVWQKARRRIAIHPSHAVEKQLLALDPTSIILRRQRAALSSWLRLLRVYQWTKNLLVFVPLVTAHRFDIPSLADALIAFLVFSLAASGVYLINDLVDLDADRKHPTKKHRPLAAGTIRVLDALLVAPALVGVAVLFAFLVTPWLGVVLIGYLLLTTAYTFSLKRKMIIDVVTLAMLYTARVVGGAAAIAVPVSEWLLAFSMFMFVCLALIKRYTELAGRLDANLPDPSNRNYRKIDLSVVAALAAASGFNAVTVFTLYISSDTVRQLYTHPQILWLICPLLTYWIGRILLLAHRRSVEDDPIQFAIKDRVSIVAAGLIGMILFMAK